MAKKIKQEGKAKKIFFEALKFIIESRNYIFFIIGLFILSGIFGFIFSDKLAFLDEILKKMVAQIEGKSTGEIIFYIFFNNIRSALFGLVWGIFFAIIPVINSLSNGAIIGYVFSRAAAVDGISSLWRILPHGIFELPAVFISLGLGARWGVDTLINFFRTHRKNLAKKVLGIATSILLVIIFVLVFILGSVINLKGVENVSMGIKLSLILLFFVFMAFVILFFFLFIFDSKVRSMQISMAKKLIAVFLLVILPLLIIAAIIEGVLIGLAV